MMAQMIQEGKKYRFFPVQKKDQLQAITLLYQAFPSLEEQETGYKLLLRNEYCAKSGLYEQCRVMMSLSNIEFQ